MDMDDVCAAQGDNGLECCTCKEGKPQPVVRIVSFTGVIEAIAQEELVLQR